MPSSPVIVLVVPGPEVTTTHPKPLEDFAFDAEANAAADSWCVYTTGTSNFSNESKI